MLRHVRNLRKIPKDHPCYPGNQKLNPVQFLDVVYEDEGGDPEPAPRIRTLLVMLNMPLMMIL